MKKSLLFISLVSLLAGLSFWEARGANTALWIGNPGVSATTNWSDNANWNNVGTGGAGPLQNDVVFGGTGSVPAAGTITSIADTTQHPNSVTFTNGANQIHTLFIPAGVTVSNDNAFNVGLATAIDANQTTVFLAGPGTFFQKGNMTVRNNSVNQGTSFSLATLDLSGLTNFVYTNTSGSINVSGTGSEARSGGALILAGVSNNITAGTINFVTTSGNVGNNAGNAFKLGLGTNIFNVNNFNVIAGKITSGTVSFQGATGGLHVRGVNGNTDDTSRANITVQNRTSGGTGGMNGTVDLTGHPVDIKAGTLTIGQAGSNPTGTSALQQGNATFSFDTGVVDATNVNMANNTVALASTFATNNVGGTLMVGSGGIRIVNQTAGAASGTLNIFGAGLVQSAGSIVKGTPSGTATINMIGGAVNMGATTNTIGTTAAPIDNLSVSNSTLTVPAFAGSPSIAAINVTPGGDTNIINAASVPGVGQFQIIAYTGLGGSPNFGLGTLPPGYQGYISNNTSSIDLVITGSLAKTDTWRGNVNGNWDTSTANWLSGGNPATYAQGDSVIFDDSLTGTPNVNLTTSLAPGQLSVNNNSALYVFSGSGKLSGAASLTKDGTGSLTLLGTGGDDFSGGIVVNNGTLILDNTNSAIGGGLLINGGVVRIGNNDGNGSVPSGSITDNGTLGFARTNDISVGTPISGTGALVQAGAGKLTLTAANSYTGSTFVQGGTLALAGSGTVSNSTQLQVVNAAFDISAASLPTLLNSLVMTNATLVMPVNASGPSIVTTFMTPGGFTNLINITSLPTVASYPVTLVIIQAAGAVGTPLNIGLGSLPPATPPYVGSITQDVTQTQVLLTLTAGPTGTRPTVSWSGADVPNLNTNWSDRLNWQLPGAPGSGDVVLFGNSGSTFAPEVSIPGGGFNALAPDFINNIVDTDFSISSLTYSNNGSAYHNTYINSGRKLSITNVLTAGAFDGNPSAQDGFVNIAGTNATLSVSNSSANLQVWIGNSTGSGSQETLDLSALDTFDATLSRLAVGACTVNNQVNRPSGILYLAKTNSISAAFQTTTAESGTTTGNSGIVVADCNGNAGSPSFLYLGLVNTISADSIGIGRQKANGHLLFNPIYANIAPYPTLTLGGVSSGRVSLFDVGNSAGNTGTTTLSADADLRGGMVNANVDTMNIGRASNGSGSGATTGSLEFDAGTINVNNLTLGLQQVAGSKVGIGSIGVGSNSVIVAGAKLVVNGTLGLGLTPSGTVGAVTKGTLGVTNGLVLANSIVPGSGSANTIVMVGGTLVVTNPIANATAALDTLTLAPQGTPDNLINTLALPAGFGPGVTVTTLNIDALDTTTNIINIESVGPVGTPPLELPLIQYANPINFLSGSTFNLVLGTLPTGYIGYLTNDTAQSMIGLVLTSAIQPQPTVNSVTLQSNSLVMSGTNGFANAPYYVVGSTNVTQPLSTWTRVATNVFGPTGNFSFSTPVDKTRPQQFYSILVTPTP